MDHWLTVTEYLCHKWPWICSTCRKHFSVLSSSMTYNQVCNWSNTTGATSGAATDCPTGAPGATPVYSGVRVTRSLVLCVLFCRSLFVLLYSFFWPLCFFFFSFFFGRCVFRLSSICQLWLLLWYLQTLLGDRLVWVVRESNYLTHWATLVLTPLVSSSSSCNVKYKKQTQKRSDIIWTLPSKQINSNILNFDEMGACCS